MNNETTYAGLFNLATFTQVSVKELVNHPKNSRTTTLDTRDMVWGGGITEPVFLRHDMTLIKGHRRTKLALENGAETIPAFIFSKELSPELEYKLLHDHGESKGLSKAEAMRQLVSIFQLGYTETQVAALKAGLLNNTWGDPSPKTLESESTYALAVKKKHRSKLQSAKRLAILPEYVAEEYISAMEEGRKSISVEDIKSLEKTYSESPKGFSQVFEAVKKAKAEEAKTGKKKEESTPKPRTVAEVRAMLPMVKDEAAKATMRWYLGELTVEQYRKIVK